MKKLESSSLDDLLFKPLPIIYKENKIKFNSIFSLIISTFKLFCTKFFNNSFVFKSIPVDLKLEFNESGQYTYGLFTVVQKLDVHFLWNSGFFGKGSLSRSEPTWKKRIVARLNLIDDDNEIDESDKINSIHMDKCIKLQVQNEDITLVRRMKRKEFKKKRAIIEEIEKEKRNKNILNTSNFIFKNAISNENVEKEHLSDCNYDVSVMKEVRIEDQLLFDTKSNKLTQNLEYLILQPVEVFFLKLALNVLDIKYMSNTVDIYNLFLICCYMSSNSNKDFLASHNKFIINFVVYYHYRSLGWCVRSGFKFGCDMILYKKGPPFSHAKHAISIILNYDNTSLNNNNNDFHSPTWFKIMSLSRVINSVKKKLILVFVDMPDSTQFKRCISQIVINKKSSSNNSCFYDLLNSFKISEIHYNRWFPSRLRD